MSGSPPECAHVVFAVIIIYFIIGSVFLRLPPIFRCSKAHAFRNVEIIAHRGSKSEGFAEVGPQS